MCVYISIASFGGKVKTIMEGLKVPAYNFEAWVFSELLEKDRNQIFAYSPHQECFFSLLYQIKTKSIFQGCLSLLLNL